MTFVSRDPLHPRRASARLELGGCRGVRLRLWRLPRGVELELVCPGRSHSLELARVVVGGERGVEIFHSRGYDRWAMVAGLPPSWAAPADPFVAVADAAARGLLHGPLGAADSTVPREEVCAMAGRARAFVREAALHAVRTCAPSWRRAALRRPVCMRAWLYGHLERAARASGVPDAARRILQAEEVAPGVSALAFAMSEVPRLEGWSGGMMQLLCHGERLPPLLGWSVDQLWQARLGRDWRNEPVGLRRSWWGAWRWPYAAQGRVKRLHRVLLRRAGPRVSPGLLLRPPPLGLHPADVPRGVADNARWYRAATGAWALRGTTLEPPPGEAAVAVARFVSQHGLWLARNVDGPVGRLVADLVVWAARTGRRPSRRSDPRALLAERGLRPTGAGRYRAVAEPGRDEELRWDSREPFPAARAPDHGWDRQAPGVWLRLLATPAEVAAEGRAMAHCAATRIPAASRGEVVLLHGEVAGVPYTLEIDLEGPRPRLAEIRSVHNAAPQPEHLPALRACLGDVDLEVLRAWEGEGARGVGR